MVSRSTRLQAAGWLVASGNCQLTCNAWTTGASTGLHDARPAEAYATGRRNATQARRDDGRLDLRPGPHAAPRKRPIDGRFPSRRGHAANFPTSTNQLLNTYVPPSVHVRRREKGSAETIPFFPSPRIFLLRGEWLSRDHHSSTNSIGRASREARPRASEHAAYVAGGAEARTAETGKKISRKRERERERR